MGIFDSFKQERARQAELLAAEKKKIKAEVGAQFIIDLLGRCNEEIPSPLTLALIRSRADFIRAGLLQWDILAQKEPEKYTSARKIRISELLRNAMEEEQK